MDSIKNFIKGKKIDKHFKKSGPGARLGDSDTQTPSVVSGSSQKRGKKSDDKNTTQIIPSKTNARDDDLMLSNSKAQKLGGSVDRIAASDIAAQAAFKRNYKADSQLTSGQKKIQMIAQRELEEEKHRQELNKDMERVRLEENREPVIREFEHSDVIKEVYYTCELVPEDICLRKNDLALLIEEKLKDRTRESSCDRITPAVQLLYTCNNATIRNNAIEIIVKYMINIIENPADPKYRRIRIGNKAFQERVITAKGACEFLQAIGFKEEQQSVKDGDPLEPFYVMSALIAEDTGKLVSDLEALRSGKDIPIKVSRNPSIYLLHNNQTITVPKVSADFFDLTVEEIKKEQQLMTEEVNRLMTLRTKEMRDRDEKLRQYKYKYTLIRVRLPDNYVIEGTFSSFDPLSEVRNFVSKHLSEELANTSWILKDPMIKTQDRLAEESTLGSLGLTPAAVLHIIFDEPINGPTLSEVYRNAAIPFVI